ncbi:TetR/AcrR family transcriptional regulator [Mycobacterium xenopi]|uniref:TetR family transcriptional regulator n=1 Tax=Mycobacterium xenopi TaxID=1789 RepID=A0AAD1H3F9_MYCXE|nr:TetR/AcrR family transcriptional regulator [Mycobacterium xenopi]MDA3641003.1 TetR/AcrR family transcriptional regulator [Mycobacterium xenopi]MDA3659575.1 TetR/AcrR family transcriptional regulator [Mycobacterium xenopi]MDA3662852.1 TetR/AcrR family transcriptional regulator [Mycobacterium xenopi]ORX14085.1 TetR family transcriptional regulator [Mycobacterium xenopi]SPX90826.1 TetR family transcriptional regulator [Mycobacterium xenopi]
MPRPRVYDIDRMLDAAESLAAESGPSAVTIRAVAAAAAVSNGALYHTFGSRAELLARTWLRAARRFLATQRALVDGSLAPRDAVVAAAEAPAVFAQRYPRSSGVLLRTRREELVTKGIRRELAGELAATQAELVELMVRLAIAMWDRRDAAAVDVITTCIVDLPTSILLQRNRIHSPTAVEHLRAAVAAVLDVGPPPAKQQRRRR